MSEIVIFEDDARSVEVRLEGETLWLSLQQLAELFGRDKSVISRHLSNIFKSGELTREAVVAKNATTAADGKIYRAKHFNLDAIIPVGYRVNSAVGDFVWVRPGFTRTAGRPFVTRGKASVGASLLANECCGGICPVRSRASSLLQVLARPSRLADRLRWFRMGSPTHNRGKVVNSTRAIRFRQWATRVLREHLTQGYSLNEHRLARRVVVTIGHRVVQTETATPEDFLVVRQHWWPAAHENNRGRTTFLS